MNEQLIVGLAPVRLAVTTSLQKNTDSLSLIRSTYLEALPVRKYVTHNYLDSSSFEVVT